MSNQAKLRLFCTAPKYKYGYKVPRNYNHGKRTGLSNSNTNWHDCTNLEVTHLNEYNIFIDSGKDKKPLDGYKLIKVYLFFDIKHDGRHKARCIVDGHLTNIPFNNVYFGEVSLRWLGIMLFLAEIVKLNAWATYIGNAYLEAKTSENVYIIDGSQFGEKEGPVLIIFK